MKPTQSQGASEWDDIKTAAQLQRQRLLDLLLIGITLSAGIMLLISLILYPPWRPFPFEIIRIYIGIIVTLLLVALTYVVARRVSFDLASAGLLVMLIVIGTMADEPAKVVDGRSLIIFVIPILAAGLLLSPKASFLYAGLSTIAIVIVGRLALHQMPSFPSFFANSLRGNMERLQRTLHDLRQREEDFRLLFADNPLPMCLARVTDTRLVEVNDAAIAHYGYTRSKFLALTVLDIWIVPPDLPAAQRSLPAQWPYRGVQQHRLHDGSIRDMAVTAHRVSISGGDAILVIAEDITERKRVEEQLRLMSRVADESPTSIVILDRNGVVEFVNHTFEAVSGQSGQGLLGKSWHWLPFPDALDELFSHVNSTLESGEVWRSEFPTPGASGAPVWIALSISALHDDRGAITHLLSVAEDITARHAAEASLQQLNMELEERVAQRTAELERANRNLERAARLKDEFLATMSHELRTPLTGILGGADALLQGSYGLLTPQQLRTLRMIESCGRDLLSLINDILDLSSIEAGRLTLDRRWVEIDDLCAGSLRLVGEQIKAMQHTISYRCIPPELTAEVDPKRVNQILVNLLDNAIKFTPKGGQIRLEVQANRTTETIRFMVSDTGIGIAPEALSGLFQPFVQVDSGLNRAYDGTGLGLVLVRRLAELHGGSVGVDSAVGEGSRFWVMLPWSPVPSATDAPAAAITSLMGVLPHPPVLLVAEDNPANSELLVDWLEQAGCTAIVVERGDEVLGAVLARRPDLILMDIQLPVMNGIQAIQLLRARPEPEIARIPILAVTALVMPGDRDRCLAAGADAYLSKPFTIHTLLAAIRDLLK
jgi:PAS domain S-box-containing protein